MKSDRLSKSLVLAAMLPCLVTVAEAQMLGIGWATKASQPAASASLSTPDGQGAPWGNTTSINTWSQFSEAAILQAPELASLLNVSLSTLQAGDVLIFEANRLGYKDGFESSIWTFTDGASTEVVDTTGSQALASGNVSSGADYSSLFGLSSDPQDQIAYVLIDLHLVNPYAAGFNVQVSMGTGQVNTPDPDALGVLWNQQTQASLDHFQCYEAWKLGGGSQIRVNLKDQFGEDDRIMGEVMLLCNPVDKNGEGIGLEEQHLVCYRVHPDQEPIRDVDVEHQFGKERIRVGDSELLCLPATKKIVNANSVE